MYGRIISSVVLTSIILSVNAQIDIWKGTKTKKVELIPYLVSGKGNAAVIVCPGGSYFWHDMVTEGTEVAHWLNENGMSAFVLRYRTAYVPAFITHFRYVFRGNRYPDPQTDLEQSLRLVRENADSFNIDANKIGVMGFSAGGHLAMTSVELLPKEVRPDFVVSVYPVVSMSAPCTHKRSRRALLGEDKMNDVSMRDSLSVEKHVPTDCPPVFLVNCKDDPVVDCHNSELLDSALTAKGIPHKYIQYKTGGHGFGVSGSKGTPESREWKEELLNWLKTIKVR